MLIEERRELDRRVTTLYDMRTGSPYHRGGPCCIGSSALTGVLDLEDARLAHPLLDVAWWNWLVRAHTPTAFARSWRDFLEGAQVEGTAPHFDEQIHVLTVLRLLETAESFRRTLPEKHPSWGTRIEAQLALM